MHGPRPLAPLPAGCSGSNGSAFTNTDGGRERWRRRLGRGSGGGGGGGGITFGDSGGGGSGGSSGRGWDRPGVPAVGLKCNVSCSGSKTTTVTGKVYDPAMKNGLYNIEVYVPAVPLVPLPKGVPTGSAACSCGALFQSGAITNTSTAVDGTFTLPNVPVGTDVPLVLQIGKWRRSMKINVKACEDNAQADKSLYLPGTVAAGDTDDRMPDIAVSTGHADSLVCLMVRIGIPKSEYVAGTGTGGHVHIFSGGGSGGGGAGSPEEHVMPGAPHSNTDLWATQAQLMPYDIVLLSCEGGETYKANPPALEAYLNAGGRAFGSHFHYAWFSGPSGSKQSYSAPADWGKNLATWSVDGPGSDNETNGTVDTTLNGSTKPFAKGVALEAWLKDNKALGIDGAGATQLPIYQPRYNASVGPANVASQPWITAKSDSTMYFSFDTPVNPKPDPDGSAPQYCGRAVFSDLHVAGAPTTHDSSPPPGGCGTEDLSAQEKALEFMLFDLSSCVIPDTVAPPDAGTPLPPPPR